jgi:calcium-dependent protein kinase
VEIDDETKLILRNVQCIVQLRQLNLNDQFKKFDADKGGELTLEEFHNFISNIDPSLTTMEIEKLFKVMDKSNDKKISIDEFKELFCNNDFSELRN